MITIDSKTILRAMSIALQVPPSAVTPELAGITIAASPNILLLGCGAPHLYRAVAVPVSEGEAVSPVVTDHKAFASLIDMIAKRSETVTLHITDKTISAHGATTRRNVNGSIGVWCDATTTFVTEIMKMAGSSNYLKGRLQGRQSFSVPVPMKHFAANTQPGALTKLSAVHLIAKGADLVVCASDSAKALGFSTTMPMPDIGSLATIAIDAKSALLLNDGVLYLMSDMADDDAISQMAIVVSYEEGMQVVTAIRPNEYYSMNGDSFMHILSRQVPEPFAVIDVHDKDAMSMLRDAMLAMGRMKSKSTEVRTQMTIYGDRLVFDTRVVARADAGHDMQSHEELKLENSGIEVQLDSEPITMVYQPHLLDPIISPMEAATFRVSKELMQIEGDYNGYPLLGVIAGVWRPEEDDTGMT